MTLRIDWQPTVRAGTLFASAAVLAACMSVPLTASASTQTTQPAAAPAAPAVPQGPFQLPALPYAYDALSGVIDAQTMELHHQRHHGAQVTGLNTALANAPQLAGLSLEQLLARASTLPPAIRNNAGGHWNHSFFWTIMAPEGARGEVSPALMAAIVRDFGSMDGLRDQFRAASMNRFGSGWSWVVVNAEGRLVVGSTPNQDNPLMDVVSPNGEPLLAIDVWEHAYYLKFQNVRADYVRGWWPIVNWKEVNRRFAGG